MIHFVVLFSLMIFAVIFSFIHGTLVEKIVSLTFIIVTLAMKYSNIELLDYGIVLVPIGTAFLLYDTVRDKRITGLKKFVLVSIYLASTLVYLFKFQHWAGATILVMLSIISTLSSVYWMIKLKPIRERQFGVVLFLTVDLILIQFGIF